MSATILLVSRPSFSVAPVVPVSVQGPLLLVLTADVLAIVTDALDRRLDQNAAHQDRMTA